MISSHKERHLLGRGNHLNIRRPLLAVGLAIGALLASGPASASATAASRAGVVVLRGGMVRLSESAPDAVVRPANARPTCAHVEYHGSAGYIAVQEKNHRLQWGIVMVPYKYSVGSWHVSTYLSGKKTTSGFNRTVKTAYTPHGSLSVPPRKVFHVTAKVVNKYGTFVNVPNACTTT